MKEKGYDGVIVKFPNNDECYYISFDKDNYKLLEGLNNNYDKVVYRVDTYEGDKLTKEQSEFFNRIDENLQPFELEKEKNRIRDVLDIMKDVQYGFISKKDGKPITDREWIHNNDLSDYYEVNKDPNKTINDKLGICQDQSIAIKYLMNKYHPEDEVVLYGVTKSPKGHCVPCYCHEGK